MKLIKAISTAFVISLSLPALAQTAAGDGHALDANLGTHYGRRNDPVRDFAGEKRLRDAITTGTAPNGMSFRGDLGYQSSDEFRAALGSNDLYGFRRDALNSGLAGYGIRGVDALQYQFALQTGSAPPRSLRGNVSVPRFGGATPQVNLTPGTQVGINTGAEPGSGELPLQRNPDEFESYNAGLAIAPMRSTSAYSASRSLTPNLISFQATNSGSIYGVTGSPLMGIQVSEFPGAVAPGADPEASGTFKTYRERFTAYQGLTPAAEAPDTRPGWEQQMEEIRARMEAASAEEGAPEIGPDAMELIRRAPGAPLKSLVENDPAHQGDYERYMRMGEETLARGHYFDSEEWFTQALTMQRGDPMAIVGRVHAQIGAGMYLSAAANLRDLYARHPELIGATYDARLLPAPTRAGEVVSAIRKRLGASATESVHAALVLAYVGRQTGDVVVMTEGLDASERLAGDDPLVKLLRQAWTEPTDAAPKESGNP